MIGRDHASVSACCISQSRGAGADELCGDAEHADLAGLVLAEIEFEQALVASVGNKGMGFDQRMMQPRRQFVVGRLDAREPQPLLTDAAVEIAIPGEIGALDVRSVHGPGGSTDIAGRAVISRCVTTHAILPAGTSE